MHSLLAGLHLFPDVLVLPVHGLTVRYIFRILFGWHSFLWKWSPFVFVGSTVHHLLYPSVPCHHTQHLTTMHAFTHALGSFCSHTVCLTDLLPPIFFFTLRAPLMSSVSLWPLSSSGMGPCMAQRFTAATIYKNFALHNHGAHAMHWDMRVSPWQMQKYLYYSQSMSNFVGNFDLSFFIG